MLFSTLAAVSYFLPAVYEGSNFCTSLLTFVSSLYLFIFHNGQSGKCEVLSYGFDLHFPDDG
jgi:hypothetical protein